MAQVSNPASLSSVIAAFGGGSELSQFVRGGAYVPNVAYYNGVSASTSGLALSQFDGLFNPVGASLNTTTAIGSDTESTTTGTPISNTVTATGSGGSGSYTFSWAVTTTGSTTVTAQNASAATTAFQSNMFNGSSGSTVTTTGTATCTVSDSHTSYTIGTVNITLQFTYQSSCVTLDTFLQDGTRARLWVEGDMLPLYDDTDVEVFGRISRAETRIVPRCRIYTESGCTLKCSRSALIKCADGEFKLATDLLGAMVHVRINGKRSVSKVTRIELLRKGAVRSLTVGKLGDGVFWAGEKPNMFIAHHNKKPGYCVHAGSWTFDGRIENIEDVFENQWIEDSFLGTTEGVKIITRQGITLRCTEQAPILSVDGLIPASDLLGRELPVIIGHELKGDVVRKVIPIGRMDFHHIHLH